VLSFNLTNSQIENVIQKMVSVTKVGKLSFVHKVSLDKMAATICPTPGTCCITIWPGGSAPVNGLSTSPCTNTVLYVNTDAIVAGCNVVAVTSSTPAYVSSGCSLAPYTFTSLQPASKCDSTAICVQGGSNGPTALNIGPSGCANIGACDCNAGTGGSCDYPSAPLTVNTAGFCQFATSWNCLVNSIKINCDGGAGLCVKGADGVSAYCVPLSNFPCNAGACVTDADCTNVPGYPKCSLELGEGGNCCTSRVCIAILPDTPEKKVAEKSAQPCGGSIGICSSAPNNKCDEIYEKDNSQSFYQCELTGVGCRRGANCV